MGQPNGGYSVVGGEGDPLSLATGIDIVRACFIEDGQAMYR